MRSDLGTLACLCIVALAAACASTPGQPPTSPAGFVPAAAAAPVANAQETSVQERHFLAIGFKPEIHDGQQVFCRRESVVGSRLSAVKVCGTLAELWAAESGTRGDIEIMQNHQTNPTYH